MMGKKKGIYNNIYSPRILIKIYIYFMKEKNVGSKFILFGQNTIKW